jgi:nucleoid-associated protein YgaU
VHQPAVHQPAAHRVPARRDLPAPANPVRLTRRGRIVVTAAVVLTIGAASFALAGAAQATGHGNGHVHSGAPAGPGSGMTKVVIRPGQSLWSVAESYDPDADTRVVIQEILQMNSLNSDQVRPGQVLWVPRG